MTIAKQLALVLVKEVIADKRNRHIAPDYALRNEVNMLVGQALDSLVADGSLVQREASVNRQSLMRFPSSPPALCKAKKRRANLLYKLRRKGIEADTKQRVIFIPFGEEPYKHIQVTRLCREYHFNIQFIIT